MESGKKGSSSVPLIIYRVLLVLFLVIGLLLLAGTVYALVLRGNAPAGGQGALPESAAGGEHIFTGIGRIRVSADGEPPMVIVNITFPYSQADKPFSEELASRITNFRTIAADYFRSFPAGELNSVDEGVLKEELLRRYNNVLRLGQIEILYFNDFLIIE
jgi:flagellar basal body-associated protein FliL